MAVASFDAQFSFQQDAVARLGERGISSKLSDEQQKKFQESPAMIAARKVDELAQQYTNDRDNQRMITDTFFRAEESDWSATKSFEYKRAVNYYDILGIEEYATLEEVKAAYKKLSLIYHPDKTKGLPPEQQKEYAAVFISVKNANLVLGDKPTRRQYDYDRDHDRANAEVQGTEVHQEQHIDLSEVLDRIKEMQRPPGQNIDVPLQCKLEKFFYGGRKEIKRKRTVRDFYQGLLTEENTLRVLIQKGASEPLATVFREQGDWHSETKPDNITVRLTSKPHPHVDRHGGDLLVREELLLGEEAAQDPRLTAHAPGLRGRHVLLWGRNPLRGSVPGAVLQLALRGEGLTKTGALRLRCRCGAGGAGVEPSFSRDSARAFLRDAVAAHEACRQAGAVSAEELRGRLEALLAKRGFEPSPRRLFLWLSAALRQVEGEWGLIAAVNAMLSHGEGAYPSLGRFLERHRLAPEGGLASGAEEAEEIWAAGGAQHGKGGLCSAPAMQRRSQQALDSTCEAELTPLGQPVSLFTSPTCVVSFYSNAGALRGPAEQLPPHSLFALCLSSSACSRARASAQWDALKEQLVPLLMGTAFLLLPAARQTLPLPLTDFAVAEGASRDAAPPAAPPMPWKRLGDEAFRRGDWYEALVCYACCLEALPGGSDDVAARVLSNRAACLAKVGEFEESVAEAKRALERKPTWGRAWSRVGSALAQLGEERKTEAVDALFKAAEFEPSIATADALADAAVATSTPSWEAAEKEKELGNTALRGRKWGAAAAHYTLGLALVPPQEEEPLAFLRAVLRSNRAAAFCRLRSWNAAVVDGRAAVAAQPGWAKTHNRLGAALLGAGQVEQAYTEFAWALLIDNQNDVARQGQEACLSLLPLWHSQPARARLEARFGADLGRPRENTRVFAISDLHFDHKPNEEWVHRLDELEFQEDVLIVAGNIANTHFTAAKALRTLKSKFRRVFYTPGNQDVWMNPGEVHNSRFPDSFSKFLALLETCDDLGVDVFPAAVCSDVFIVPLLSWYNAQFDKKSRPDPNYNADETCVWPLDAREQLWKYMLKLNEAHLERAYRGTVISVSHFLPLATLPFSSDGNIRAAQSMGCEDIEDHIRMARSSAHVYGHSTMSTTEQHGGVMFANHYHGYLEEGQPEPHSGPLLLFDGSRGLAVSDSRKQQQQQDGSLL